MTLVVVMFPDQPVIPQITQALQSKSSRCNRTQNPGDQPASGKRLDRIDQASRPCRRDAQKYIHRKRQMKAGKDQVNVEEQGMLFHQSIVDRPIPQQETSHGDHRQIHNTGNHVFPSIGCALDEQEDAGNHVDDQGGYEKQPEFVEVLHDRLAVWWDFDVDVMVDERVEERPVVSTVSLDVGCTVLEFAFSTSELLLSATKFFGTIELGLGGGRFVDGGGLGAFVGGGYIVVTAGVHARGVVECALYRWVGEGVGIQRIAVRERVGL